MPDPTNTPTAGQVNEPSTTEPTTTAITTPTPTTTEDWKTSLPEEIKGDPSLAAIQNVESLAKSYVSAQKMIGKATIPVPDKFSSDADWQSVFHRLGVPEKFDDYQVKAPEGSELPEENLNQFKQIAHAAGVLPTQAEKILGWYNEFSKNSVTEVQKTIDAEAEAGINSLKQEWGQAYEKNLAMAQQAVEHFGDEKVFDILDQSGVGNDPNIIKLMAKVGQILVEDKVIGEPSDVQSGVLSPKDAQEEINKIYGNKEHAYNSPGHPNHKAAVQEMFKLNQMAFGNDPVMNLSQG